MQEQSVTYTHCELKYTVFILLKLLDDIAKLIGNNASIISNIFEIIITTCEDEKEGVKYNYSDTKLQN